MLKRFFFLSILITYSVSTFSQINAALQAGVRHLYLDGDGYNAPYRIPAITTAKNGDVIALNDRRYCGADIGFGHVDIVGRVSRDHGRTWGTDQMVMKGTGTKGAPDCGYGDAALVADRQSDRVLLMAAAGNVTYWNSTEDNPLRIARCYGTFEKGQWVWSKPEDVTEAFYTDIFKRTNAKMFFGSGRICQSRKVKVDKYYRLYAALCTGKGNFVVFSDDFGQTWNLLGNLDASCAPQGDEPKAEELPDGSVLLSSRKSRGRFFNIFTYTDVKKGTGKWAEPVASDTQTGGIRFGANSTNGEIYMMPARRTSDGKRVTLALQSAPTADRRANIKIFYKELADKGTDYATPALFAANWDGEFEVTRMPAAYSTMTLQHDGRIGFYMEENPDGGNYNMVYVPIDMKTLTNGAYSPE